MVGYTDQPQLIIPESPIESELSSADIQASLQCPARQAWFEYLQLSLDALRESRPFYLH